MGRISDDDIQRVRDATDLPSLIAETVVLKKRGRLLWGLCPFHGEKTPSFKVDPATQLWHCFGCGEGGDAFGFVMRTENLDFPDAVRRLAERARIELHEEGGGLPAGRKERLIAVCEAAAAFYNRLLLSSREHGAEAARAYLQGRGMGSEVAKRFALGYAPGRRTTLVGALTKQGFTRDELLGANLAMADGGGLRDRFFDRVMFPIRDLSGRTIAFGGRVIGKGEPKYLNTAETPIFSKSANLYNIDRARNEIVTSGGAVVVEGYTDVIALVEAGIGQAVATLGTALTARHVRLLGRFAQRVVYLFDGDAAGIRAADRAAEFIDWHATPEAGSVRTELLVAVIPGGQDPAEFVAASGADAMRELIADAQPLLRFVLDQRLAEHDLSAPEGRARALEAAAGALVRVRGSLLEQDYTNYLAGRLLTDFPTVARAVQAAAASAQRAARPAEEAGPAAPAASVPRELTAQEKAETELVRLAVLDPVLRPQAQELLDEGAVIGERTGRLLKAVLAAGEARGKALYDALAREDRAFGEAVSAWLVGTAKAGTSKVDASEAEEVEYAFREISARLKDMDLERLILKKKALMRTLRAESDRSAFDELYKEIAALQRRQVEVRRAMHQSPTGGGGTTA